MIGSTFVFEPDEQKLLRLADDYEALDDFVHIHMDVLISLDFAELLVDAGVSWGGVEPVVFLPDDGFAIVSVPEDCLTLVLEKGREMDSEQQADLARLADFVRKYGKANIYEISTF